MVSLPIYQSAIGKKLFHLVSDEEDFGRWQTFPREKLFYEFYGESATT
jgi:hypothetical protein